MNQTQTTSVKQAFAEFIVRLTSRKFLVAIGGIVLIATGVLTSDQVNQVLGLIVAYITAEGAADVADRYSSNKAAAAQASLQETQLQLGELGTGGGVDRSTVVAGSDIPMV